MNGAAATASTVGVAYYQHLQAPPTSLPSTKASLHTYRIHCDVKGHSKKVVTAWVISSIT